MAQSRKTVAIAVHMVEVSIDSSQQGLFCAGCFLLKERSVRELCAEERFYIQISIELKTKIVKRVVNRFDWFKTQEREHSLS